MQQRFLLSASLLCRRGHVRTSGLSSALELTAGKDLVHLDCHHGQPTGYHLGPLGIRGSSLGGSGYRRDVVGDLTRTRSRFMDGAADLVGGGRLLLDGRCDRRLGLADPFHLAVDLAYSRDGGTRVTPDGLDRSGDLARSLGRLLGQLLYLVGDDGKAPARFARPGCLNGGVQRQQVGLSGDATDDLRLWQSERSQRSTTSVPQKRPPRFGR